jgi:MATE family multidrug resistance protein
MGAQYGNLILAANTILLNFFFIFSYGIDGFAHASEVLVANYFGEKNLKLIKKSIISTGKLSFILMILYLVFFLIFDQRIISFITTIESVQIIAIDNSIWLYLIFLSATIAFWLDGVFIGILKIKLLRNTMIIAAIIFFVLETMIIGGNNSGLWLSFLGFFMVRSFLLGLYLIKYMRKDRFLV